MNDPNAKYGISKPEELSFFNYHEFLVAQPHEEATESEPPALVITHFPNNYVSKYSSEYETTRIVRIPRAYDASELSYMVPQFSTFIPGTEPAAITGTPAYGEFDNTVFGTTSSTPLIPQWVDEETFTNVVQQVNSICMEAFTPYSAWTVLDNLLELLSGTLYSRVFNSVFKDPHTKRKVHELDLYIEHINDTVLSKKHPQLRLVNPQMSGFLSLDFQIPRPDSHHSIRKGSASESG